MASIKTAFLGVAHIHTPGFVDQLKTLAEAGDVSVKSVWDPDAARAAATAEKVGAGTSSSVASILADPEITAVIVCSETALHKDIVLAAAAAGKNLFVEKPIGIGKADADAMADAIEKAGVVFQTGYMQRGQPLNQFIKKEVAAGHLGKLTRARYSNCHGGASLGWFDQWKWFTQAELSGGGALLDMGAHPLDLIVSTYTASEGKIVDAHGSIANRTGKYGTSIDEYGTALLTFESGFQATFDASWIDKANLRSPVSVYGTEGSILALPTGIFYQSEHVEGADGTKPLTPEQLPPAAPHAFRLFWDHLLGRPTQVPLVPVREAALGAATMERLYASAKKA
ncbi:MAG: Gfo/Idh/MocA family oxidoreductase [Capsulimonadaceae bacterium]|nr:Gfo/Idh/MocA family oxidoreductase [Capsulimonadaceae bacterium]